MLGSSSNRVMFFLILDELLIFGLSSVNSVGRMAAGSLYLSNATQASADTASFFSAAIPVSIVSSHEEG